MRVLMLAGSDRSRYDEPLARALARHGVATHFAGDPSWVDFGALTDAGVTCHEIAIRHKLDFRARRKVRRILRDGGFDLLHAVAGKDAYVGLRARGLSGTLPVVVTRGAYHRVRLYDPGDWFVYGPRGADRFVAVSEGIERCLVECGIAPERVRRIYTGVYAPGFASKAGGFRAASGLRAGGVLFGFLGNRRRSSGMDIKGFDLLLDALGRLARTERGFHLAVVGNGFAGTEPEIAARGLGGRVSLLGWQADPRPFAAAVDCLVVPSRLDALPRSAIEATVLGTPVVASRVGGLPEILDEGAAGVLVEPGDAEALAAALFRAMREPEGMRELAAAARRRNRDLFGVERAAREHLELYREVLVGAASRAVD